MAMKQGDGEVGCDGASASAMAIGVADDEMRLLVGQGFSTSGIDESTEVSAAIGDQATRVVAGEVSRPVVQAGETRPPDARRSVPKWEFTARERVRTAIKELHKPLNNPCRARRK